MSEVRSSNQVVLAALDKQIASLEREPDKQQPELDDLDGLRRARAALIRANRAAITAAAAA
jgi:hypothetical protein